FRYPGIRSDSDMFTFGYRFKPWNAAKDIAPGPEILAYLNETVDEYGLREKIWFQSRVTALDWSSTENRWIATVNPVEGEPYEISARFVSSCTGYYDYGKGYLPEWDGYDDYQGQIAHPQQWPENLDYAGKKVVVIGSGATAVTIVPTIAETAAHVTIIQRSPTYIFNVPSADPIAKWLRKLLPNRLAYKLARIKNILLGVYLFSLSKRKPQEVRKYLRKMAVDDLGEDCDVDTHFNPDYDPWDQRLCLIPDGDFYGSLKDGTASIVTEHIDRFTETGIRTKSGETIDADIVVPATELQIQFGGGMRLWMDGKPVNLSERYIYRGMMLSGIPNLVVTFGYTNASWTLKSDLTADFVCRLVNRMANKGAEVATAVTGDGAIEPGPLVGLNSGYLLRATHLLPKSGAERPWKNYENYILDMLSIRYGKIEDGILTFSD
ncbi:MAG: NAD(P)/FAD-dependent oxidoreductase, partial [Paracoccaceae bacterium]|nr:NAD(P)/FAD-dependent oxidoreductase [Paracoccaceae bacterium]